MQKAYINTTDGQIHYRYTAQVQSGCIPLVMLHQTASASVMYEKLMTILGEDYAIIAPDTPGYGQSYDPPKPPSIAYYAETLKQLFDALEITQCYLFGHHTGASIAVQFAHDYPSTVLKMMLSGPPYLSESQKNALAKSLTAKTLDADGQHMLKVWKRIYDRAPDGVDLEFIQREVLLTLRATNYADTYHAVFEQDFVGQLASIDCPVHVICGEFDTIRASAEPTHQALPNSELTLIPNAGTFICDDQPEIVAEHIRAFFK